MTSSACRGTSAMQSASNMSDPTTQRQGWVHETAKGLIDAAGEWEIPHEYPFVQLVLMPSFHPNVVLTLLGDSASWVLSVVSERSNPNGALRATIAVQADEANSLQAAASGALRSPTSADDTITRDGMAVLLRTSDGERAWYPAPMSQTAEGSVIELFFEHGANIPDIDVRKDIAAVASYVHHPGPVSKRRQAT